MDISDLYDDWAETMDLSTRYQEAGWVTGGLWGLGVGLVIITALGLHAVYTYRTNKKNLTRGEKVTGYVLPGVVGLIGISMLSFFAGGILGMTAGYEKAETEIGRDLEEYQSEVAAKIVERAKDTYGVTVNQDKVKAAWLADDDAVIPFGATHDGKDKSLGIRFDESTKTVIIYQGNEALEPAQN